MDGGFAWKVQRTWDWKCIQEKKQWGTIWISLRNVDVDVECSFMSVRAVEAG